MLLPRVITAVVLLLVLVSILMWGGPQAWEGFVAVVLLTSFWEWARLGKLSDKVSLYFAAAAGAACLVMMQWIDLSKGAFPLLMISGVFWVAYAPWCLKKVSIGALENQWVYLFTGILLIGAACLALLVAHSLGVVFLLSVVAICWVADIFAYVFGKTMGKRKLAPSISPGKSWEGAIGGTLTVVALSWGVVALAAEVPVLRETWQFKAATQWHPVVFTLWLVVISGFSIVGDLLESMLKRRAGLKDSSYLLPGHGGVLDRIDAQLPVLPLAMLLVGVGAGV